MAQLEPVHVMEKDRASSMLRLTRINPTRLYVRGGPSGPAWFTAQNQRWFGVGGGSIDPEQVPEDCKMDLTQNPILVDAGGPAVTSVCKICSETMNSSQMEDHLLEQHVKPLMQSRTQASPGVAVGSSPDVLPESPPMKPTRGRPRGQQIAT